jgi:hypothetical protein
MRLKCRIGGEDGVVGHAEAAVDLDRPVKDVHHHVGGDDLDRRDRLAGALLPAQVGCLRDVASRGVEAVLRSGSPASPRQAFSISGW